MACPQVKTSKARKRKRRSHHALAAPGLSRCRRCGAATLPHTICLNCGHYRGRPVLEPES